MYGIIAAPAREGGAKQSLAGITLNECGVSRMMKISAIVAISCFAFGVLAQESAEDYAKRLNELGALVQNGSEGDMAIYAKVVQGAEKLLNAQSFNCADAIQILQGGKSSEDCLLVVRANDRFALDTYFDELAPGAGNSSIRASMKAILREMDKIQLYVIGHREEAEGYEVSSWYLLTEVDDEIILLSHERVYT